jgi:hypothetical protein
MYTYTKFDSGLIGTGIYLEVWRIFFGGMKKPLRGTKKPQQNKPVAGSQFLGGHCRKNVTEVLG